MAAIFLVLADFATGRTEAAVLPAARASAASPRFEFQTASGLARPDFARPDFAVMNGFGALPLPSAIWSIDRPEATEASSSRTLLALPSLANSSRCLISNQ